MRHDDWITGDIVDFDGQYITIRAPFTDAATFIRREYKTVDIRPKDSRRISDKQRRNCYAMIREIADWMGEIDTETKEFLKYEFMAGELLDTADGLFSLADAPMSLVAGFQSFLARFIVRNEIPTRGNMLEYVDDTIDFIYACLTQKRCCICGTLADLHHCDTVGSQSARDTMDHLGQPVLPLCRKHHEEAHQIGQKEFEKKYTLPHGVEADKTICKLYGLRTAKK